MELVQLLQEAGQAGVGTISGLAAGDDGLLVLSHLLLDRLLHLVDELDLSVHAGRVGLGLGEEGVQLRLREGERDLRIRRGLVDVAAQLIGLDVYCSLDVLHLLLGEVVTAGQTRHRCAGELSLTVVAHAYAVGS